MELAQIFNITNGSPGIISSGRLRGLLFLCCREDLISELIIYHLSITITKYQYYMEWPLIEYRISVDTATNNKFHFSVGFFF